MAKNVKDEKDETRMPTREDLFDLKRKVAKQAETLESARGEIGSLLKNADNDKNIHRGAFKLAVKLLNMTDEKRDAFLSHLDYYRDQMGIDEGRTQNMFDTTGAVATAPAQPEAGAALQ